MEQPPERMLQIIWLLECSPPPKDQEACTLQPSRVLLVRALNTPDRHRISKIDVQITTRIANVNLKRK